MSDHVEPTKDRPVNSWALAGAIAYAGGTIDGGWVVPATEDYFATILAGDPNSDLSNTGAYNAFATSSSGTSLDVTVDTGEAFVAGRYIAVDQQSTVTLAGSTADQTVYVGWDGDTASTVIVGVDADFTDADGQLPIGTFDTNSSGVTNATDDRVTASDLRDKVDVTDSGNPRVTAADAIDFGANLDVTDDGDNTVTVDADVTPPPDTPWDVLRSDNLWQSDHLPTAAGLATFTSGTATITDHVDGFVRLQTGTSLGSFAQVGSHTNAGAGPIPSGWNWRKHVRFYLETHDISGQELYAGVGFPKHGTSSNDDFAGAKFVDDDIWACTRNNGTETLDGPIIENFGTNTTWNVQVLHVPGTRDDVNVWNVFDSGESGSASVTTNIPGDSWGDRVRLRLENTESANRTVDAYSYRHVQKDTA